METEMTTMTIVRATVIALQTPDGFCQFEPHVTVGQTYLVDLQTVQRQRTMVHQHPDGSCVAHCKDIIYVAGGGGWLPLELIRLEA
jgi:hypothetical protein